MAALTPCVSPPFFFFSQHTHSAAAHETPTNSPKEKKTLEINTRQKQAHTASPSCDGRLLLSAIFSLAPSLSTQELHQLDVARASRARSAYAATHVLPRLPAPLILHPRQVKRKRGGGRRLRRFFLDAPVSWGEAGCGRGEGWRRQPGQKKKGVTTHRHTCAYACVPTNRNHQKPEKNTQHQPRNGSEGGTHDHPLEQRLHAQTHTHADNAGINKAHRKTANKLESRKKKRKGQT